MPFLLKEKIVAFVHFPSFTGVPCVCTYVDANNEYANMKT
jgi:hypothetical protein